MRLKGIDAVVVGADRIARNGDTANKIGDVRPWPSWRRITGSRSTSPPPRLDVRLRDCQRCGDPDRRAAARRSPDHRRRRPSSTRRSTSRRPRLIAGIITEYGVLRRAPTKPAIAALEKQTVSRVKYYEFLDKAANADGLVVIEGDRYDPRPASPRGAARPADPARHAGAQPRRHRRACDRRPRTRRRRRDCGNAVFSPSGASSLCAVANGLRAQPRARRLGGGRRCSGRKTRWSSKICSRRTRRRSRKPFGKLAGRKALRIDTTVNAEVRDRFVRETLAALGCVGGSRARSPRSPRAKPISARSPTTLRSSHSAARVTLADLERESLAVEDPKGRGTTRNALIEGRTSEALEIAFDLFCERSARGRDPACERGSPPTWVSSGSLPGRAAASSRRATAGARARAAPGLPAASARRRGALRVRSRRARLRGGRDRPDRRSPRNDRAADGGHREQGDEPATR